ncbi:hypothetical protein [Actinokineospora iranica]|uniref:Integral membrane protein n=1 Tax=Actinokineospora iranica TaxID=1271860 RepID=A0A1G6SYX4_9PSEU|nr:hypothetical protein [Actinokineospora iranica]SDD22170.1 hypothetical protein SAMN05216174_108272 [Actinokineospora iranica]
MRFSSSAPRTVVAAGALVALQGLVGLGFAVLLLIRGLSGDSELGGNVFGEAAYFAVLAAGVLACGGGLVLGKHWGRSPAIVLQLLLLGIAWYAIGPSDRPEIGVPVALVCVVVLVLLSRSTTTQWAQGDQDEPRS